MPHDDHAFDQHPAHDLHADAEPQYVEQERPTGVPMYNAPYGPPAPPYWAQGPGYPHPPGYAQTPNYAQAPGYSPAPGYAQVPGFAPGTGYPGQYGYPTAPRKPSSRRRVATGAGALALAAGLVLSGVAIARVEHDSSSTAISGGSLPGTQNGGSGSGGTGGTGGTSGGSGGTVPVGPGTGQSGTSTSASVATKSQQVGVVTVVSVLGYNNAESAGTGMILTANGEILTNNHVIQGATSITVTVESTGRQYRADVVGDAPTKDVAVLQLRNASGLATAKIGDSSKVVTGDAVTGVGNAGGAGVLRAAPGKVTALRRSITASDETGTNAERLTGLFQTNAGIVSGDSGGPLYDSSGAIIGMDTAAATTSATPTAYAIPIAAALSVAKQIEAGTATETVHIGYPAFIGITVDPQVSGGVGVDQVLSGGPAESAGVTQGSTITGVNGTAVSSQTQLHTLLHKYQPGQSIRLTWTDASGSSHTASLTLIKGPAD